MLSISTEGVSRRDRPEFWADLVSRHVTPVSIAPADDEMRGRIEARPAGDAVVAHVEGQGLRAAHTRRHVVAASEHRVAACLNVRGTCRVRVAGDAHLVQAGDIFFTDSREPFALDLDCEPWQHHVISWPDALADAALGHRRMSHVVMPSRLALGRLWAGQLQTTAGGLPTLSPPALALVAAQLLELLAQLVRERHDTSGTATASQAARAAVHAAACREIGATYADPRLGPTSIARALGVSTRTLARAFADADDTLMGAVTRERVRRAARLLASPAQQSSVTDVAFACGFTDLSHFGHVFAERQGCTPSAWRERHRRAG